MEADVEINIVKKCMEQLLYHGCIQMIDIFLHSNIYAITENITKLASNSKLQQECVEYVTNEGHVKPTFSKIFALYSSIQPGLRICDFMVLYTSSLKGVNVRKMITFGLIHHFIRRVHRYPVWTSKGSMQKEITMSATLPLSYSRGPSGSLSQAVKEAEIKSTMNGIYNTDQLCCMHMIEYAELEKIVNTDDHCLVVHK